MMSRETLGTKFITLSRLVVLALFVVGATAQSGSAPAAAQEKVADPNAAAGDDPVTTIRATHSVMISRLVTRTLVG